MTYSKCTHYRKLIRMAIMLESISVFLRWFLLTLLICGGCGKDRFEIGDASTDVPTKSEAGFIPGPESGTVYLQESAESNRIEIPRCNPFLKNSCGDGYKCDIVAREGNNSSDLFAGCLLIYNEKDLGVPCEPWKSYTVPGSKDTYLTDTCKQGLICVSDRVSTCQPLCSVAYGIGCKDKNQYCGGIVTNEINVCLPTEDCDPLRQRGCSEDEACYIRQNRLAKDSRNRSEGIIAVCASLPVPTERVDVNEPCLYINDCSPGYACWGPPRLPPSRWTDENILCRPLCDPDLADASLDASLADPDDPDDDAGSDGTHSGQCPGTGACVSLSVTGWNLTAISTVPALCE